MKIDILAGEAKTRDLTSDPSLMVTAWDEFWKIASTVRTECLDWLLILGRRHLDSVMRSYIQHYNTEPPASWTRAPATRSAATELTDRKCCHPAPRPAGGLMHEYRAAA
jgi:hypothetical protein